MAVPGTLQAEPSLLSALKQSTKAKTQIDKAHIACGDPKDNLCVTLAVRSTFM